VDAKGILPVSESPHAVPTISCSEMPILKNLSGKTLAKYIGFCGAGKIRIKNNNIRFFAAKLRKSFTIGVSSGNSCSCKAVCTASFFLLLLLYCPSLFNSSSALFNSSGVGGVP
jgi:hypothetical protein